jgi:hypothetical protein
MFQYFQKRASQDVAVFAGGLVQVDNVVQGSVAVEAGEPEMVSALTNTGITAPVVKPKT